MDNFFGTLYSQEDLQRRVAQRRARNPLSRNSSMTMVPGMVYAASPTQMSDGTETMTGMIGAGHSLDDIISQNNDEMRRQSLPQGHGHGVPDIDHRRSSMLEFGSGNQSLNGFQFGRSTPPGGVGLRRQSSGEMDMTSYANMANMSGAMDLSGQGMGFTSPIQGPGGLTINTTSPFSQMSGPMIPTDVMGNIGFMSMGGMEGMSEQDPMSANAMNMFSPTHFQSQYGPHNGMESLGSEFIMQPNLSQGVSPQSATQHVDSGIDGVHPVGPDLNSMHSSSDGLPTMGNMTMTNGNMVNTPQPMEQNGSYKSPVAGAMNMLLGTIPHPNSKPSNPNIPPDEAHIVSQANDVVAQPDETNPVKLGAKLPKYQGVYSSSGFDMLGALMKVAIRKNPEIDIGKVDLSCAFVVCDVTQYDCPIIYISDIFERMTGYTKYEVIGQNCRFLQSPEGKVEAGAVRKYVDNDSVYYLKNRIQDRKEAQTSLINHRKGGQPFMNLLTMIPITGEDDLHIKYYVGFQVDLLDKPTSVQDRNASGHYTVDYSNADIPRYQWAPPDVMANGVRDQTTSRDDVSTILNAVNTKTESELTKRMWDKVLLENTDDVVHVLSLKGLFLYLSPSSRTVLEYDPSELVGTALSSVCHPSDIVPVTRELKETSTTTSVNVVFRIRRKKSGYTWFESHGSLSLEQGKGRKCIILVGRERPVYALHRSELAAAGGIGENEMWTKLSTSGMFLFASANVQTLLDRSPSDLLGTSIQQLMRGEHRKEFGRVLERARTGKRITHPHDILNRKGLVLRAQTTLYPGDAAEGQKPTFLVAQTRLLKSTSRVVPPPLSHNSSSSMSPMARMSDNSTPISHQSNISMSPLRQDNTTSRTTPINPGVISQAGGAGLAIGSQDLALASEENMFDELKTTRCTSWQYELRQMEKSNRSLSEELAILLQNKKKRKRCKGNGNPARDCANCHTRVTPEWRRGPSGQRDLCNSCGLRWAKSTGRTTSSRGGDANKQTPSLHSTSPAHSSPLHQELGQSPSRLKAHTSDPGQQPNLNVDLHAQGDVKRDGAALTAGLGGRTTAESMPVHKPGLELKGGGENGITNIREEG